MLRHIRNRWHTSWGDGGERREAICFYCAIRSTPKNTSSYTARKMLPTAMSPFFAAGQEERRKDVERNCRVLQAKLHIVALSQSFVEHSTYGYYHKALCNDTKHDSI